jgi:hypothetical protein
MADKKITQLDALTSVAGPDLFLVVDDPSGTPTSKKVTAANILSYVQDGVVFPFSAEDLDDLGDVAAPSPSNGDVLKYNGTAWVNSAPVSTFNPVEAAVFS